MSQRHSASSDDQTSDPLDYKSNFFPVCSYCIKCNGNIFIRIIKNNVREVFRTVGNNTCMSQFLWLHLHSRRWFYSGARVFMEYYSKDPPPALEIFISKIWKKKDSKYFNLQRFYMHVLCKLNYLNRHVIDRNSAFS